MKIPSFATKMTRLATGLAFVAAALSLSAPANAAGLVPWGRVNFLGTGWSINDFWVKTTATPINPDGCTVTNAGYTIDPSAANLQVMESLLITAYAHGDYVEIEVSGCSANAPSIIAVYVQAAPS